MRVLGVILAGGEGSRLGGADKALEVVAGRTCLDRVISRLGPQVEALVLVAHGEPKSYAAYGVPVLRDAGWPARDGPLAGVIAGLEAAAAGGFDAALTAAVDTPFFPPDLRARLAAGLGAAGPSIAQSSERAHPVFGIWPAALAPAALAAFEAGERSPDRLSQRLGRTLVSWRAEPFDPFVNLNTPQDRARLEAIAASLAP